jgi:hypothetical protein
MKWSVIVLGFFVYLLYSVQVYSAVIEWSNSVVLNKDFVVAAEDTLFIQSGTSVILDRDVSIIVNGVLQVNGSSENIVQITSTEGLFMLPWLSIVFQSGANLNSSYINFASINKRRSSNIEHAAINVKNTNPSETLVITNTVFKSPKAIDVNGASIVLSNNRFDTYYGVKVLDPGNLIFEDNIVEYTASTSPSDTSDAAVQLVCSNSIVAGYHSIVRNSFYKQRIVLKSLNCSNILFKHNVAEDNNIVVISARDLKGNNTEFKITDNSFAGLVNVGVSDDENVVVTVINNYFKIESRLVNSKDAQVILDVNVATFENNVIESNLSQQVQYGLVDISYRSKKPVIVRRNVFQYNYAIAALKLSGYFGRDYPDFEVNVTNNLFLGNGPDKCPAIDVCRVYGLIDISGNDYGTSDPSIIINGVRDYRADESNCQGIAKIFPAKNDLENIDYEDLDWRTGETLSGVVDVSKYAVWRNITIEPGTILTTSNTVFLLGQFKVKGTSENPIKWNQQSNIITRNADGSKISSTANYESGSIISHVSFTSQDSSKYLLIDTPEIYIENITLSVPFRISGSVTLKNSVLSQSVTAYFVSYQLVTGRYTKVINFIGNTFNNLGASIRLVEAFKVNLVRNKFQRSTIAFLFDTASIDTKVIMKENTFRGASTYPLSLSFSTAVPFNITLYQNIFNNPAARGELFLLVSESGRKIMPRVNAKFNYWGKTTEFSIDQRIYNDIPVDILPFFMTENVYDISGKNVYPPLPLPSNSNHPDSSVDRHHSNKNDSKSGVRAVFASMVIIIVVLIGIVAIVATIIGIAYKRYHAMKAIELNIPLNEYNELTV